MKHQPICSIGCFTILAAVKNGIKKEYKLRTVYLSCLIHQSRKDFKRQPGFDPITFNENSMKVMGLNPGYLLKSFLLYMYFYNYFVYHEVYIIKRGKHHAVNVQFQFMNIQFFEITTICLTLICIIVEIETAHCMTNKQSLLQAQQLVVVGATVLCGLFFGIWSSHGPSEAQYLILQKTCSSLQFITFYT